MHALSSLTRRAPARRLRHPALSLAAIALTPFAALAQTPPGIALPPVAVSEPERAFDFWVGEWDAPSFSWSAEGWQPSAVRTMKVESVLGGRGVVEFARSVPATAGSRPSFGFSLRTYDRDRGHWVLLLNWPSPNRPLFYALHGSFRHGRGEFFTTPRPNQSGGTTVTRYTFSDIAANRLRWDGASTSDGGKSWATNLVFEFTRRPADAAPLDNGAAHAGMPWMAGDAKFRAGDRLIGAWTGTRVAGEDRAAVNVSVRAVMGGAMLVEEAEAGGEPLHYAVSCFDAALGRWVRYELRAGHEGLLRYEGEAFALVGAAGQGSAGSDEQVDWTFADGGDRVICAARRGDDEAWRLELSRAR